MKLVMVTTYATPNNMRRELLDAVIARGHRVTVVSPEPAAVMDGALAALGGSYRQWPVNRTGIDPVEDLRSARHLHSILRAERPDVVLVYQIKAVLLAPLAARLARVARVVPLVNGLGAVFDQDGFGATARAQIARRAYALSLRLVDEVVFQNADDPALLRSLGLLPRRARWRVVPGTGVDLARLQLRPPFAGPPTFTLIARLVVSKGVRDLAAAARIVRTRYPEARFRIVGQLEADGHPDGVRRAELDAWVAEGLIDYAGFTDDVPGVLAATTAFVLPSYYREGVPRTNLEALAIGRPIVTTDWVGCRDTVEDGVNGFLVAPKDPVALAERLERYLRDPALAARHGAASRALAERRFDVHQVNAQMLEALQLAGQGGGAR
ncbi:MAG TPA: glycosyltransferase family 4 protein [Kofleriaceae bacterium]|jgi:glycosyltransferase involved in cell wall biosynthesis|nr:glycosyltransferase family 4 protein [Kofleriaceae bacterium]